MTQNNRKGKVKTQRREEMREGYKKEKEEQKKT